MVKTLRTLASVLFSFMALTCTVGLPRSPARDALKPRAIPAYGGLDSGIAVTAALAPDGRRVAVLAILPPASQGAGPYPLTLQIWDAVELKLLTSRAIAVPRHTQVDSSSPGHDLAPLGCLVRYAGDGGSLVVSEGSARVGPDGETSTLSVPEARLHILSGDDLRELRTIDLELASDPRVYGLVDIQISPVGDRVAVALSPIDFSIGFGNGAPCQAFQGSEARVYDLGTGRELWKEPFENARIGGLGWAPDGLSLALTLQSGPGEDPVFQAFCPVRKVDHNLLVLESASGRVLSGLSTGDLAGPVCLGPRYEIFTAPFHFFYQKSSDEKVKVWNAQTGALERTIACPGRDVHDLLALSRDGSVLVGYVGKEKFDYSWRAMQEMPENLDQRFAIWDARSGTLIRISPSFAALTRPPGKHPGQKEDNGRLAPAIHKLSDRVVRSPKAPDKPQLQMASDGSRVLTSWPWFGTPLLFDVSDTRSRRAK